MEALGTWTDRAEEWVKRFGNPVKVVAEGPSQHAICSCIPDDNGNHGKHCPKFDCYVILVDNGLGQKITRRVPKTWLTLG